MTKVLLLFDVDGTLIKTGGAGMRAMKQVGRELFGDRFSFDGVQVSGHLDPLIFAEAAAINGLGDDPSHHEAFRDHYIPRLEAELEAHREHVQPAPGITQALAVLRQRLDERGDVVLGLLTGNYTRAVPIKLTAAGIDPMWFTITAFGDEASSRAGLVELAIHKYACNYQETVDPRRVIVIGDTPRDVACARAHGCVALAVATGPFGVEQLRDAGADVVVEDLSDPGPLLGVIDAPCM